MPSSLAIAATWLISITVIALILFRPRRIPEYIWAAAGALLLVLSRLVPWRQALASVREGANVYLFLTGMMLLAGIAREHGVFDWLAEHAMEQARGSRLRLFSLVYGVGILVTALLSNDATAVVLTPAVLAVVRRGRMSPLPYLFACAFVANAASFVLPISNPANLIVFANHLPSLAVWLRTFLLPAMVALAVTFVLLYWHNRHDLTGTIDDGIRPTPLSAKGRRAAFGILSAAAWLLVMSALDKPLGLATCAAAAVVLLITSASDLRSNLTVLHDVSWGVLPLVAGLFVMVDALNHAGALPLMVAGLHRVAAWPHGTGPVAAAFGIGLSTNVINNLPVGLIGAAAIQAAGASPLMHAAVLLGINLGPNLSVAGSLATILWLIALRRENIDVSGSHFLRVGILIMPTALLLAAATLVLSSR
ncbi:MAG TPA: SLC13 family permease [Acidobacteriaceae bacterium]|jgi:arsenical pump membrane protein|nr:SLC13 family permease [Acidobacteriaceae bacterium]